MRIIKLIPILAMFGAMSCSSYGEKYNIQGSWKNGEGQVVYLKTKSEVSDEMVVIDSAIVDRSNRFSFKGVVETMTPAQLIAGSQGAELLLFNTKKPIKVEIESKPVKVLNIGESDSTEVLQNRFNFIDVDPEINAYQKAQELALGSNLIILQGMLMMKEAVDNGYNIDTVSMLCDTIQANFKKSIAEFFDTTRNYRAATYLITEYALTQCSIYEIKDLWENLSPSVKESVQGRRLLEAIGMVEKVNIGGYPDDFTLPTPDGGEISLYSLRGNIVLLDFWASWCRPCLEEMPNVKNIYEKYHGKGLEILGVSLDGDGDHDKWVGAIEKNGLIWKHGSTLQGWECPIAKRFNVTGIPRMYIIDRDGKIIAQDLRGEELARKMDELFAE